MEGSPTATPGRSASWFSPSASGRGPRVRRTRCARAAGPIARGDAARARGALPGAHRGARSPAERVSHVLVPDRRRASLLRARDRAATRITALWDRFDVLLTPTRARTAITADGAYECLAPVAVDTAARFAPFTAIFNLTGQPALAVPAGWGDDGLPLSVQLVGRGGSEDVLYALAGQFEQAAPWADRRPPGF